MAKQNNIAFHYSELSCQYSEATARGNQVTRKILGKLPIHLAVNARANCVELPTIRRRALKGIKADSHYCWAEWRAPNAGALLHFATC